MESSSTREEVTERKGWRPKSASVTNTTGDGGVAYLESGYAVLGREGEKEDKNVLSIMQSKAAQQSQQPRQAQWHEGQTKQSMWDIYNSMKRRNSHSAGLVNTQKQQHI